MTIARDTECMYLSGFLFELLDGSLVNAPAFVNQMTGGGGLSRIDMANDHNVDVYLFLSHDGLLIRKYCKTSEKNSFLGDRRVTQEDKVVVGVTFNHSRYCV